MVTGFYFVIGHGDSGLYSVIGHGDSGLYYVIGHSDWILLCNWAW